MMFKDIILNKIGFTLTQDQERLVDILSYFVFDDKYKIFLLKGYATQGLDLSFVVAYTMRILFPSVLVHQLLEKGYDVKDLPTLSYEAFFKEVLSSYFSEAM